MTDRSLPPPRAVRVVATDLDRTFTRADLSTDPEAVATARRLRAAGITTLLATGRRAVDLAGRPDLLGAFDGFVVECGAVWGVPGDWRLTSSDTTAVRKAAAALADQGCPVEEGVASFSVSAEWARAIAALPQAPSLSVQPNRDRIDVVPHGVDKAAGLRPLLAHLGLAGRPLLAIGDGENDLPMLAMASRAVAVANAAPVLRAAADEVAPHDASRGFTWAVQPLLSLPMLDPLLEGRS